MLRDQDRTSGVASADITLMTIAVLVAAGCVGSAAISRTPTADEAFSQQTELAQKTLVQQADLTYVGAFRVPTEADLSYDHSGHGLTFDPQRQSLFVSNYASRVSEISIPAPGTGTTVESLPRATMVQGPTDVLRGRLAEAGNMIGGLLVDGDDLIVSAYILYDAAGEGVRSHFRVSKDFTQNTVAGPVQVGPNRAGFVGGPMIRVPTDWQPVLGAPALTGLCCVSIITRTSHGPAATAFDPADVTSSASRIAGEPLLQYPASHTTLGAWNSSGKLWNNASSMAGMVWVEGTNSLLYFGRYGSEFCYGPGEQCGDPSSRFSGDHAYPYDYFVWAYDADDLARVKQGRMDPWEVKPYATWAFTMPFATAGRVVRGVAYDPAAQRIYLAEQQSDGVHVVIRVLDVNAR